MCGPAVAQESGLRSVGCLDAWLLQPLHFPREPKIFDAYRDWDICARQSCSFASIAAIFRRSFEGKDSDENVFGMIMTANLFDTVGR